MSGNLLSEALIELYKSEHLSLSKFQTPISFSFISFHRGSFSTFHYA